MKKSIILMFCFAFLFQIQTVGAEIVVKKIDGSRFQDEQSFLQLEKYLNENLSSVKKSGGKKISKEDLGNLSYVFLLESKRNNLKEIPVEFLDKKIYVKKFLNFISTKSSLKDFYSVQELRNIGMKGGFFYLDYDTPAPVSNQELSAVSQTEGKGGGGNGYNSPTPVSLQAEVRSVETNSVEDIPVSPTVTVVATKAGSSSSSSSVLTEEKVEQYAAFLSGEKEKTAKIERQTVSLQRKINALEANEKKTLQLERRVEKLEKQKSSTNSNSNLESRLGEVNRVAKDSLILGRVLRDAVGLMQNEVENLKKGNKEDQRNIYNWIYGLASGFIVLFFLFLFNGRRGGRDE